MIIGNRKHIAKIISNNNNNKLFVDKVKDNNYEITILSDHKAIQVVLYQEEIEELISKLYESLNYDIQIQLNYQSLIVLTGGKHYLSPLSIDKISQLIEENEKCNKKVVFLDLIENTDNDVWHSLQINIEIKNIMCISPWYSWQKK